MSENRTCNYDADGTFRQLRNKSTGETFERDDLRLLTPAGPYQDLRSDHREGSA
ncbi:hypothetical protein [Halorussus salinus]|uniref:hypothetical protein n=1 Tax=Halorussus salinus TaxID=1364935 RepID=UPI00138F34BB|nr:hypothetical protein [Halorussus salinus]